ncbi:hypothetical protein EYF80_007322 [Liparis tanakae]|uniref:Uncharacterized protein n=1 Tax=Liparis tanakae TaxID=230148 RepID=A0A4Z2IXJ4_9TELE|nr:hypothetical protein EYF80_007322 [Liparis tanakae]
MGFIFVSSLAPLAAVYEGLREEEEEAVEVAEEVEGLRWLVWDPKATTPNTTPDTQRLNGNISISLLV